MPRAMPFSKHCGTRGFSRRASMESAISLKSMRRTTAILETKVAYMRFKFKVTIEVVRIESPHEIEAKVEGIPLGIVGRLTATSVTKLAEAGDETKVHYAIDATLTGKLGSLGQPVLKAKAKEMEKQFTQRLRAAFEQTAPGDVR